MALNPLHNSAAGFGAAITYRHPASKYLVFEHGNRIRDNRWTVVVEAVACAEAFTEGEVARRAGGDDFVA